MIKDSNVAYKDFFDIKQILFRIREQTGPQQEQLLRRCTFLRIKYLDILRSELAILAATSLPTRASVEEVMTKYESSLDELDTIMNKIITEISKREEDA